MERFGWTWQDYCDTPAWVIDKAIETVNADQARLEHRPSR